MSETAAPSAVIEGQQSPVGTVTVSRVVDVPVDQVWKAFNTKAGVEALLGPGAMLGGKGEHWRSSEGTHGVLRSYHPLEQIRVSWHADEDAPKTLVDIHLAAEGASTQIALEHQNIDPRDSEALQERWVAALDRVVATID